MTLSRVVVLPEKSMRRTKNCLPSSAVRVRSILSVFGDDVEGRLGHEVDEAELAIQLAHASRCPCAACRWRRRRPRSMPNSGRMQDSGVRNSFTPDEVDLVQVVQPAFFHRDRDVGALARRCSA